MRRARYLSPDQLAPMPDPVTGQPRPPRAPRLGRPDKDPRLDPNRDTEPGSAPDPPPGQGPVLAWYRSSRRGRLIIAAWVAAILIIIFSIGTGFSLEWMLYWWMWLFVLVGAVLAVWFRKGVQPSAGADWLQDGGWVRTYELTKVTAWSWPTGIALNLTDRDGRKLNVGTSDLLEDPLIWDLVYNGIMHSVIAGGARTNGVLHSALRVPYPQPDDR